MIFLVILAGLNSGYAQEVEDRDLKKPKDALLQYLKGKLYSTGKYSYTMLNLMIT